MGSTNHGAQDSTYEYFEAATAEDFNKKDVNIRPTGIYKGGYLTRVSDVAVTLSAMSVTIGDGTQQVNVRTTTTEYTINTGLLDSGTLSSSTPYLVLRWAFVAALNNYVEIHALAVLDAAWALAYPNDVVIGKCNFTGATLVDFDYSDRTFLHIQDLFLKVETASGMYVRLRAGKIQDGSQYIHIPEQLVGPFSVPSSPNSRVDLVYLAADGTATILQGGVNVSPSAPDYGYKLVLAEVTIVNGDLTIPASRIIDVRSFVSAKQEDPVAMVPATYTGQESVTHSNGLIVKNGTVVYSGVPKAVAFGAAFPTGLKSIQLTVLYGSDTNATPVFRSPSLSGFTVSVGAQACTVYWEAKGY